MLERLRKELHGTFLHWIPIRRDTQRKLKELARNLQNLQGNTGVAMAATAGSFESIFWAQLIAAPFTLGGSLLVAAGTVDLLTSRAGSYHTRPENQANDFEKVYRYRCRESSGYMSYLSSDGEKKLRLAEVQVAIDKDHRACAVLQRQLDSLRRAFTSSSAISSSAVRCAPWCTPQCPMPWHAHRVLLTLLFCQGISLNLWSHLWIVIADLHPPLLRKSEVFLAVWNVQVKLRLNVWCRRVWPTDAEYGEVWNRMNCKK